MNFKRELPRTSQLTGQLSKSANFYSRHAQRAFLVWSQGFNSVTITYGNFF